MTAQGQLAASQFTARGTTLSHIAMPTVKPFTASDQDIDICQKGWPESDTGVKLIHKGDWKWSGALHAY